jgi:hypothetical protein
MNWEKASITVRRTPTSDLPRPENSKLDRHPGEGRDPSKLLDRPNLEPGRIPACAGMTLLRGAQSFAA